MREILFRAKRIDYDKFPKEEWWIEGNAFVHDDGRTVDISTGTEKFSINKRVIPETLCQYTGLKDKNGNRIWENDIVDASEEWWSASGPAGHNSPIIKVEWLEGLTGFDPFANYDCDCGVYIDASGCEVIGNIFDNPELLKGE